MSEFLKNIKNFISKYKILFFIFLLVFMIDSYRSIYKIGSNYFTIWNKIGSNFYIIPYKYYNILTPNDNYILVEELVEETCTIYLDTNSKTIYFCAMSKYKIVNHNFNYRILRGDTTYESIKGNSLSGVFDLDGKIVNKEKMIKFDIDLITSEISNELDPPIEKVLY